MRKALFLDRDGVINIDKGYVWQVSDFEFTGWIFDLCRKYRDEGYMIIVVTNQAGIARQLFTEDDFHRITEWMVGQFSENGIRIEKVYYCPHHPDFNSACDCRKPNPGMLLTAAKEFQINMQESILIGDKESDIQAGINAGIKYCLYIQDLYPDMTQHSSILSEKS